MIFLEDDLWYILTALENNTRRELLKMLANYDSYALELSKMMDVSHQAINKQLELLERWGLVSSNGMVKSNIGAPRKIYKSQGFSTIIIDYSKNFMEIKKMDISHENDTKLPENVNDLLLNLQNINNDIEDLENKRNELIEYKDKIIEKLKMFTDNLNSFDKKIVDIFIDTMSVEDVSKMTGISADIIREIISKFITS